MACIAAAILLFGDALTEHSRHDWPRAQRINCVNNLQEIGLAFRTWALDNANKYPCNVSTNAGGAMEVCVTGAEGFENNAAAVFQVMSNELSTPIILVCPHDRSKTPANHFSTLASSNISYRLRSGPGISDSNPTNILGVCPICGNILRCDGSVSIVSDNRGAATGTLMDLLRYDERVRLSVFRAALVAALGAILLWFGVAFRWNTNRVAG
jgi:hypothetical protein